MVGWTRAWYLVGYCHLRRAHRVFRLYRVQVVAPHDGRFTPPADFDCLGYVLRRVAAWGGTQPVEVVLNLSLEEARRKVPPGDNALEPMDAGVDLRSRATDLNGFARFLLGLGCALVVREPSELKGAPRRVAREVMQRADDA